MLYKLDGKRADITCGIRAVLRSLIVIAEIQYVPFLSTADRTVVMAAAVIAGDGRGRYYLLMRLLGRLVLQYPTLSSLWPSPILLLIPGCRSDSTLHGLISQAPIGVWLFPWV